MSDTLEINYEGNPMIPYPTIADKESIKYIIIKEGFTKLPSLLFDGFTNLLNITLPESLVDIENDAFGNTFLKYLFLPKKVKNLNLMNPFDTSQIEYIDVDPDNPYFCSVDGILFSEDKSILFMFPPCKNLSIYMVPNTVSVLGFGAFNRAIYLKKLYIPDSVVSLSDEFLYGNYDVIEEVVIFRYFRQSIPFMGPTSFAYTTFQKSNIKYVYSALIPKSCQICYFSLLKKDLIYAFILL